MASRLSLLLQLRRSRRLASIVSIPPGLSCSSPSLRPVGLAWSPLRCLPWHTLSTTAAAHEVSLAAAAATEEGDLGDGRLAKEWPELDSQPGGDSAKLEQEIACIDHDINHLRELRQARLAETNQLLQETDQPSSPSSSSGDQKGRRKAPALDRLVDKIIVEASSPADETSEPSLLFEEDIEDDPLPSPEDIDEDSSPSSVTTGPSEEDIRNAAFAATEVLEKASKPKKTKVAKLLPKDGGKIEISKQDQIHTYDDRSNSSRIPKADRVPTLDHPWPEWVDFLQDLYRKGYAKLASDEEKEGIAGEPLFERASLIRNMTFSFGRDRDDIVRHLSKKHIKVVSNYGCPSTDNKVVNAGKYLRKSCGLSEGEVCPRCDLKRSCTKAFLEPEGRRTIETLDVVRFLVGFACSFSETKADAYPKEVETSVRALLKEMVRCNQKPRDSNLPRPRMVEPLSKPARSESYEKRPTRSRNNDDDDTPHRFGDPSGDWLCPDCGFSNFSRNRACKDCGKFRPPKDLRPGDWQCQGCGFHNFSKNMICHECQKHRPTQDTWRGGDNRSMRGSRERFQGSSRDFSNRGSNDSSWGRADKPLSGSRRSPTQRRDEWKSDTRRMDSDDEFDSRDSEASSDGDVSDHSSSFVPRNGRGRSKQEVKMKSRPAARGGYEMSDVSDSSDFENDLSDANKKSEFGGGFNKTRQTKGQRFGGANSEEDVDYSDNDFGDERESNRGGRKIETKPGFRPSARGRYDASRGNDSIEHKSNYGKNSHMSGPRSRIKTVRQDRKQ